MTELKPSGWGIRVDKSNATETYHLRGTVFPKESSLNYEPTTSIGYKQSNSNSNKSTKIKKKK
jgi:hypothetical protein